MKAINKTLLVVMVIVLCGLSIGFSSFSSSMSISEISAIITPVVDIEITNISVNNTTSSAISNYEEYHNNIMSVGLSLPNSDSSIRYKISITNYGNVSMAIKSISGLPEDLEYSLDGYNLGELLCDSSNQCNLGSVAEFYITIKYKNGSYTGSNNYDINLYMIFSKPYRVNYNIPTRDYPTSIMESDNLVVNFAFPYCNISVSSNDGVLTKDTDYTYNNGVLTVNNVVKDINISVNNYISNTHCLYDGASKTTGTSNGISYNYASSVSLMNDKYGGTSTDDTGNLRYYGANPNNYVYFNCSNTDANGRAYGSIDYNYSSSCAVFRIIGVFNEKDSQSSGSSERIKIVSSTPNTTQVKFHSSNVNNWIGSSSQVYLNGTYSLTPIASSMIKTTYFSLGGIRKFNKEYANQVYAIERGTVVPSTSYQTYWVGNVGLIYPSDAFYSADFTNTTCARANVSTFGNCNNYMWLGKGYNYFYTMNPITQKTQQVIALTTNATVTGVNASTNGNIFPSMYLNENIFLLSGNGSSSSPYVMWLPSN